MVKERHKKTWTWGGGLAIQSRSRLLGKLQWPTREPCKKRVLAAPRLQKGGEKESRSEVGMSKTRGDRATTRDSLDRRIKRGDAVTKGGGEEFVSIGQG